MTRRPPGLIKDDEGTARCFWCGDKDDYIAYHDREWGMPVVDDHRLYEKICLEGFQSGLSWLTVLRKREAFRAAFSGFDFDKVARFRKARIERMLKNAAIIRHRGKIESAINNAKRARELRDEFGSLAAYFWSHEPTKGRPKRITRATLRKLSRSPESTAMAKDLKRRGWSFVGPTTLYAFMQASGIVNDHLTGCSARDRVERARDRLKRPR